MEAEASDWGEYRTLMRLVFSRGSPGILGPAVLRVVILLAQDLWLHEKADSY